jgi:hypothetical protein
VLPGIHGSAVPSRWGFGACGRPDSHHCAGSSARVSIGKTVDGRPCRTAGRQRR